MSAQEKIEDALEYLYQLGGDPRHKAMHGLLELQAEPPVDNSAIELQAVIQRGGAATVTDQHGRKVVGVKSVACFKDQSGQDVLQVNL